MFVNGCRGLVAVSPPIAPYDPHTTPPPPFTGQIFKQFRLLSVDVNLQIKCVVHFNLTSKTERL